MPYLDPPRRVGSTHRMPTTPTGLAFLVGGGVGGAGCVMIVASLLGWVTPSAGTPPWLLAWVGGLFVLAGGICAAAAGRHAAWRRRARALAEPWRRDHPWPPGPIPDDGARALRGHALGLAVLAAFLVPLHALFGPPAGAGESLWAGGRWIAAVVLGIFDLVLVLSLAYFGYRLLQWWRYGRARLVLEGGPPFWLGAELRGQFVGPTVIAQAARAEAALRGVEEYMTDSGRDRHHVAQAFYEERAMIRIDPQGRAAIRFPLPEQGPPTCLIEVPTRYWELVVEAELPGVDYQGVFLVPVYARPA